jgi:DNA-binding Xre family transcriptional regulator
MKTKLNTFESHLKSKLRNKRFADGYAVEKAKVELAHKIAELRHARKISQVALAKRLHVTQQFISQLESGEGQNMTLETLSRIAESLGSGVKITFPKELGFVVA